MLDNEEVQDVKDSADSKTDVVVGEIYSKLAEPSIFLNIRER